MTQFEKLLPTVVAGAAWAAKRGFVQKWGWGEVGPWGHKLHLATVDLRPRYPRRRSALCASSALSQLVSLTAIITVSTAFREARPVCSLLCDPRLRLEDQLFLS